MAFWPDGYRGAISLSFDDGLESHLATALPLLNARSLRGTFYLNPAGREDNEQRAYGWREGLQRWLPAHQAGHELGNHTVRHPCSLNTDIRWAPGVNLLDWTLEQIEADTLEAQQRLGDVFPAQGLTSFAYPCYESTVGRGLTRTSYVPMIARHFSGARARGELQGNLANDPRFSDRFYLSSWAVERQTGAFMVGLAERAMGLGYWGIYTFHGIQEGHLPVGDTDFIELLNYLAGHRNTIWIAPVAEIANYLYIQGI